MYTQRKSTDLTMIKWIQRKCNIMYIENQCVDDSRTIYFLTLNFHIANFLRRRRRRSRSRRRRCLLRI